MKFNEYQSYKGDPDKLIKKFAGKTITKAEIMPDVDSELRLTFTDGTYLTLRDGGRSCCEGRFMSTSDDIKDMVGSDFVGAEVKEGPDIGDGGFGTHESMFLDVTTSTGVFQFVNHNDHNGYYGGFSMVVEEG